MDPETRLELIAMLAHDRSWDVIVRIGQIVLDEVYPANIFTSGSPDTGPRYVVALREALDAMK
jgi:hypothetical protein